MDIPRVKRKFPIFAVLLVFATVTFLFSWLGLFPRQLVESVYARSAFPAISHVAVVIADVLPFSWLDVWISGWIVFLIYVIARRRWRFLIGAVSLFYLWFFWGWGLNYHRLPLANRMHLDTTGIQKEDFDRLAGVAVQEINRLWPLASRDPMDRDAIASMAAKRVDRVILGIDGIDWPLPVRVKRSLLAEPWYLGAGIDGMFNPYGHEALVIKGPLPFELPFLMSHEIAHVHGIANEGEANLVALLATLASDDPLFQYSGWLELRGYLPPASGLDPGPSADLAAISKRILSHRIRLMSNVQTAVLDAHLKANAVPGGIESYSDFVALAIASQKRWKDFR